MRTYTLHVTVADPGDLVAVVAAVERLGHPVECPAFDEQSRRARRDSYLRMAHALMPGPTCWARCCQLEAEISRFEAIQWPRLRDHETPPEPCSRLRRYLFEARRLGPLPTTARHLWNIVAKRNAPGDFKEKPL